MLSEFEYVAPTTVDDAIAALATPGARSLAGGQGVLTAMKLGLLAPPRLVDLRRVADLHGVDRSEDGSLRIGAMTTLTELLDVPGLAKQHPALARAAGAIADTQIRNRGTVGGTLVDHFAASDLAAVLLVSGAELTVAGPAGRRTVPATGFYSPDGPLLDDAEILVAVHVPVLDPTVGVAYERATERATLAPLVAVAVATLPGGPPAGGSVRVAVTGGTRWPMRLAEAEAALAGGAEVPAHLPVGPDSRFVDGDTVSAAYRAHLTRVLIGRALSRTGRRDA